MKHTISSILCFFLVTFATTVNAQTAGTNKSIRFICENGTEISAVFHQGDSAVEITYGDKKESLPRVVTASGAKYQKGSTSFWNKGEEAFFETEGQSTKCKQAASESNQSQTMNMEALENTPCQFVKFEGGDGQVLTSEDPSKYTLMINKDGTFNVRFDCNRGRGTWKSKGSNQIEFGPMALTRAMCLEGSLHDHFVKHWPNIRSFTLKDGHLFLSLMADGGVFEFEPVKMN